MVNAARLRIAAMGVAITLVGSALATGQPAGPIAIRNARLVPVSGAPIESGTIVVADGLITAIGARVEVPPDATVIDGAGLTVYPGLFDAFTDLGVGSAAPATGARPAGRVVRGPQDRPGATPWIQAADEFRADDRKVEQWRNGGVTSVVTAPRGGVFPGQAAVVNLSGERREAAVVRSAVAVPVALTPPAGGQTFPGSLMGVIAYVRQVLLDTRHAALVTRQYEQNPKGKVRPDHDRTVLALQDALDRKAPFLLPATTDVQIDRVLRFGQELDVPFAIYGAHEGYASAGAIAKARVPVLVSARWPERPRDADPDADEPLAVLEVRDKAPGTPAALAAQRVPFAFYSDGLDGPADFLSRVRTAVRAGLSPEAAVRALTLGAAEIFGVADRLGSLETGKIANLVVTQGDLLGDATPIRYVFVDGRRFDVPADASRTAPNGRGPRPSEGAAR